MAKMILKKHRFRVKVRVLKDHDDRYFTARKGDELELRASELYDIVGDLSNEGTARRRREQNRLKLRYRGEMPQIGIFKTDKVRDIAKQFNWRLYPWVSFIDPEKSLEDYSADELSKMYDVPGNYTKKESIIKWIKENKKDE